MFPFQCAPFHISSFLFPISCFPFPGFTNTLISVQFVLVKSRDQQVSFSKAMPPNFQCIQYSAMAMETDVQWMWFNTLLQLSLFQYFLLIY